MGHGYEKAYPFLSSFERYCYKWIIGNPDKPLTKRFGYVVFFQKALDENCSDQRAHGRSPQIIMHAVFPRRFDANKLFSASGKTLLDACWDAACSIQKKGATEELELSLPREWYSRET